MFREKLMEWHTIIIKKVLNRIIVKQLDKTPTGSPTGLVYYKPMYYWNTLYICIYIIDHCNNII